MKLAKHRPWRYQFVGCLAVTALVVTPELLIPAPSRADEVTSWLEELDSPDAHARLEAIRKIGNWAHPDLSVALLSDDLDARRQARERVDEAGLAVVTRALVDRLARNVDNGAGYEEGSVCVTSPGGIRKHIRVECENEALAKALKQLGATEAVELLKRVHGECMKLPAEERSSSATHTFAYCIYMLSMEQVDVWEAGKARPFEPSPILEEEARRLLRPDLKPTGGLTAALWMSSASRYPQFFVGNSKLVVVLTLTNCTDEAIPLDLAPQSIAFSLVDSGGHRTNIPAEQLAQPVRDATLRSLGPGKSATCTWHIDRLNDSPLGKPMKPGYVALKAIYSPSDEAVRKQWRNPTLISNTLNQPCFENTHPDEPWHLLRKGKLATVEVERTLYEKPGHPHFFVHIRVTNDTDRILGVDLRDYWKVVYPNQWGPLSVDHRECIDEGRVDYPPLEQAARDNLLADLRGGKLTTIPAGKVVDYYREFNASGRADVEKALKDQKYLFVSLNGQQLLTDGKHVEQIPCDWEQTETGNTDLIIAAPAPWKKIPDTSRIVSESR